MASYYCSLCNPNIVFSPRNTVCVGCFDLVRTAIDLVAKNEGDKKTSNKPVECLLKYVNEKRDTDERMSYIMGVLGLFKDLIHTDIQLKPGNNGPSLPAHRSLLALKSVIFKNMVDSCKAQPDDTVPLPELNHEELESLLEFLYSGSLAPDKMEKHVYSLSLVAHNYEIDSLQKCCERHMLKSLSPSTALGVLEVSDVCSNQTLKHSALNFIVNNKDIVFSGPFEEFALKHPHLAVQITRASFHEANDKNQKRKLY